MKFLKAGKVVILTNGKYAGKKAVLVKTWEEGNDKHPYPHALVVGIDRAPLAVHKSMTRQRITKRSRVRPFVKLVNFNHVLPTRYAPLLLLSATNKQFLTGSFIVQQLQLGRLRPQVHCW